MPDRLLTEIKQSRPFKSTEQEVYLNLLRTSDALYRAITDVLKPYDLSQTQYNVLRILRGAGPVGVACGEIGNRMVKHDPDITRLLDRLQRRKLVTRSRDQKDRRVILARITNEGLKVLQQLDPVMEPLPKALLGHISAPRLRSFLELLEEAREKVFY